MAKKTAGGGGRRRISSMSPARELEKHVLLTKQVNHEEELTNAFNPMQDMHLWTMWRSAVTGKIVDETKSFEESDFKQHPYGKSLVQIPLQQLIKLEPNSWEVAQGFMNPFRGFASEGSNPHRRSNPSSHPTSSHPTSSQPRGSHQPSSQPRGSHQPSSQPRGSHQPSSQPRGSHQPSSQPRGSHQPSSHKPRSHTSISHPPSSHPRSSYQPSSQGSGSRNGSLGTSQFVFYGVPRAVLKKQ